MDALGEKRMMIQSVFSGWLMSRVTNGFNGYRHHSLKERPSKQNAAIAALKAYVYGAHEDARKYFRGPAEISLDPFGSTSSFDPARGYPETLESQTLKGYFGEIFAGLVIEYFAPFGE